MIKEPDALWGGLMWNERQSMAGRMLVKVRRGLRSSANTSPLLLVALCLVAGIWAATLYRLYLAREEALRLAEAMSASFATSFAAQVEKTLHDTDVVVQWLKYEFERSPATFNLNNYHQLGIVST